MMMLSGFIKTMMKMMKMMTARMVNKTTECNYGDEETKLMLMMTMVMRRRRSHG